VLLRTGGWGFTAQQGRKVRGCVVFQGQDRVADSFGVVAGNNEGGGGQELAGDAVGVEGPLAGAAVDADMTVEGAAVAEVEADAAREEGGEGGLRVDRASDAGGEVEDFRLTASR
jgi:hypothetical protein